MQEGSPVEDRMKIAPSFTPAVAGRERAPVRLPSCDAEHACPCDSFSRAPKEQQEMKSLIAAFPGQSPQEPLELPGAAERPMGFHTTIPLELLSNAGEFPAPESLLKVPDTRQTTDYSCGASALQAVLMYYGEERDEYELMEMLKTDPKEGTNPKDIVRVAKKLGYRARLEQGLTLERLEQSVKAKTPVIVAMQAWRDGEDLNRPWSEVWDSGHYVVVVGIDDKNIYFEDPSLLGSKGYLPRKEFEERWHDVDDKKYVHSGIFIDGKPPSPPPPYLHIE